MTNMMLESDGLATLCPTCSGRKHYLGIGNTGEAACSHCSGNGYLLPEFKPEPGEEAAEAVCEPAKAKRAYRKRDNIASE